MGSPALASNSPPVPVTPAYNNNIAAKPVTVPTSSGSDSSNLIANAVDQVYSAKFKADTVLDKQLFKAELKNAIAEFEKEIKAQNIKSAANLKYIAGDIIGQKGMIGDAIIWLNNPNDAKGTKIFELAKSGAKPEDLKIDENASEDDRLAISAYILLSKAIFPAVKDNSSLIENTNNIKDAKALASAIETVLAQVKMSRTASNKVIADNLKTVSGGFLWGTVGANDGAELFKYNGNKYSALGIMKGFIGGDPKANADFASYMNAKHPNELKHPNKLNLPPISGKHKMAQFTAQMLQDNKNIFTLDASQISQLTKDLPEIATNIKELSDDETFKQKILEEVKTGIQNGGDPLALVEQKKDELLKADASSNPNEAEMIRLIYEIHILNFFSSLSGDLGVAYNNQAKTKDIELLKAGIDSFQANTTTGVRERVGGENTVARVDSLLQAYNEELQKQITYTQDIAEKTGLANLTSRFVNANLPEVAGQARLSDVNRLPVINAKVAVVKSMFSSVVQEAASELQAANQGIGEAVSKEETTDTTIMALIGQIFDQTAAQRVEPWKKNAEAGKSVITQATNSIVTNLTA